MSTTIISGRNAPASTPCGVPVNCATSRQRSASTTLGFVLDILAFERKAAVFETRPFANYRLVTRSFPKFLGTQRLFPSGVFFDRKHSYLLETTTVAAAQTTRPAKTMSAAALSFVTSNLIVVAPGKNPRYFRGQLCRARHSVDILSRTASSNNIIRYACTVQNILPRTHTRPLKPTSRYIILLRKCVYIILTFYFYVSRHFASLLHSRAYRSASYARPDA